MGKSKKVPLAKGLIGGKINSIHGQLELFLEDHDIIKIVFSRKPYGGKSDVKFSIMGIGLNTNIEKFPGELENTATSLKMELGKKVDNEKILKQIVKEIKKQLKTISE